MIHIQFNKTPMTLEKTCSLSDLLHLHFVKKNNFFAVAINRTFIPQIQYATTLIKEGDLIDIILPMQGG